MDAATLPDSITRFQGLKSLVLALHNQVFSQARAARFARCGIEHLKLLIAKLRRQQFGRSSEKREHQIEQLELRWKNWKQANERNSSSSKESVPARTAAARPVRRPLPVHLPREVRKVLPKQEACPDCGGS